MKYRKAEFVMANEALNRLGILASQLNTDPITALDLCILFGKLNPEEIKELYRTFNKAHEDTKPN